MEWKKYCTKRGEDVVIENDGKIFGCITSLPFTNCCMEMDCIYHNTNFLSTLIAIKMFSQINIDFSSWSLESCELFITKNMHGRSLQNYCKNLPSRNSAPEKTRSGFLARIFGGGVPEEDPAIYGSQLKSLREDIRAQNNSVRCLVCGAGITVDFKVIEKQIRENQQLAKNSLHLVIFSPGRSNPKVCKTCRGVICNDCAKKALTEKKNDRAGVEKLLLKQATFLSLPEKDRNEVLERCLSPDDPSTIPCPKCRNSLLEDIDHITD